MTLDEAKRIADHVRKGMPVDGACRLVGVHRRDLGRMLKIAQEDIAANRPTTEAEMASILDAALGEQERALVEMVRRGGEVTADGERYAILAVRKPDAWKK